MTHGKTYNKSPRRINHKTTKSKTNTGTTALERSVEQTTGAFKVKKKLREKSRECHNHKPQPFPDPKRKRKPTNPNKHKPNKRTKSTKTSPPPSEAIATLKRTEKHKNKTSHGKTHNKYLVEQTTKQQRVRLTPGPPPLYRGIHYFPYFCS